MSVTSNGKLYECPKWGTEVQVNDMPPAGKGSQAGRRRIPGTPVDCPKCGESFEPRNLYARSDVIENYGICEADRAGTRREPSLARKIALSNATRHTTKAASQLTKNLPLGIEHKNPESHDCTRFGAVANKDAVKCGLRKILMDRKTDLALAEMNAWLALLDQIRRALPDRVFTDEEVEELDRLLDLAAESTAPLREAVEKMARSMRPN